MDTIEKKYNEVLKNKCKKVSMDHIPSASAAELIYKIITLDDIYLPINLSDEETAESIYDIAELIKRIDMRMAALGNTDSTVEIEGSSNSDTITSQVTIPTVSTSNHKKNNHCLLIRSMPGSGKTTFCKRLTLAILEQDTLFFEKYSRENKLQFSRNSFPVFVRCNAVEDFSAETLLHLNFHDLLFKLLQADFGQSFAEINQEEFDKLLCEKSNSGLTLILDGWDEILDYEKELAFVEKINSFLTDDSNIDIVITIRENYSEPEFNFPYTRKYSIKPLSDTDIREFCKRWCKVLLGPKDRLDYSTIANQILGSKNQQVLLMMKNPFDLSLLLITAKDEGQLPENKAVLFDKIINMYIHWSHQKNEYIISEKSTKMFLSYIACAFTKNNIIRCEYSDFRIIVSQCITDFYWRFKERLSNEQIDEIIKELLHTGLISQSSERSYSFSNSGNSSTQHKQIQEYMSAYALYHRYTDSEFNGTLYTDIFEKHYSDSRWHEVIIFFVLMGEGHVPRSIINQLIEKAEKNNDNYHYTNLLFSFIINGADIEDLEQRHKIYDVVFEEHITDKQITYLTLMLSTPSKFTEEFEKYIHTKFTESVSNGDTQYGFANAIIEATNARANGVSPFDRAAQLMLNTDIITDVVAASQILLLLGWCRYEQINNIFAQFYNSYKMPPSLTCIFKKILGNQSYRPFLLQSVKDILLADFAKFKDIISESDIDYCCEYLNNNVQSILSGNNNTIKNCEELLMMAPVLDDDFVIKSRGNVAVKEIYLQRLNDHFAKGDTGNLIFTFSICASLGCWNKDELVQLWIAIDAMYSSQNKLPNSSKTRYYQLRGQQSEYIRDLDIAEALNSINGKQVQFMGGNNLFDGNETESTTAEQTPVSQGFESSEEVMTFKVMNDEGKEVECEVLFTFESEETGKNYIVYTDNSVDEYNNTRVYASIYDPNEPETRLMPIESEREWRIIETILSEIQNETE